MRIGREERRGAEWEALARLDYEPSLLDPSGRVARKVATARDVRPEGSVGKPLKTRLPLGVRDDVLIEAQLTTGSNDAEQLRERRLLVGHGTEHKRRNPSIKRCRLGR